MPIVALVLAACAPAATAPEETAMAETLRVTSASFQEGRSIPSRHSCDGADLSPPLAWSAGPDGTQAYALVVDDPDARGWVHWVAADVSGTSVAEGTEPGTPGRNDFGRNGWGGPCPPSGTHRYVFTVYALSAPLSLEPGFTADELRAAMAGRVLAEGRLTGTYARGG